MSEDTTPINNAHIRIISGDLRISPQQVEAAAMLLADGGTVPFIARYRKEATGSLDEVAIAAIRDRMEQLAELDKRRASILESLKERDLLTNELQAQIEAAPSISVLEDIYLPFRPKRKTRAMAAREKGLEPLALVLLEKQDDAEFEPVAAAEVFVSEEKGVAGSEDALAGARDIIAEMVNEDSRVRSGLRHLYRRKAKIISRVLKDKEADGIKYKDYFEWQEAAAVAPSHRILAMLRGEKEGFLSLCFQPAEEEAMALVRGFFVKAPAPGGDSFALRPAAAQVPQAVEDGYRRLLAPSMETELRGELKQRADEEAIRVFAGNLRELLLSPPLGQKTVMAIDPGFRTGCKLVCLGQQGQLLFHDTIYPHTGGEKAEMAGPVVMALCERFGISAIAIGNGTAGRETETFIRSLGLPASIVIVMVNESGASIYSASKVAREEFPDQDVTVRGSVSIGRRLMDPLAELVKLDPKSIGVGQYQHDVDQKALQKSLDDVVMSCVNAVGVDVNTASRQLLSYVAGLGPQLARNLVAYRDANGPFPSREALKKVPRMGPKAFEQAAGFLRITDGQNPLDASAVHPESYRLAEAMAADLQCSVADLMRDGALRAKIDLKRYACDGVGMPTLHDIRAELEKPGRDPRGDFEPFAFAEGIEKIDDLKVGQKLPGIVTNVTAFGAFVDVGVHQDGLVHLSHLCDRFASDPAKTVRVHQKVTVTVIEVDLERKRISLSMKSDPFNEAPKGHKPDGARSGTAREHRRQQKGTARPRPERGQQPRPPAPKPKERELRARPGSWLSEAMQKAEKR